MSIQPHGFVLFLWTIFKTRSKRPTFPFISEAERSEASEMNYSSRKRKEVLGKRQSEEVKIRRASPSTLRETLFLGANSASQHQLAEPEE
jgi:hypothetical protein